MSTQRLPDERAGILRFLLSLQFALAELPRWLLLAVIVYAPWAFGCTRWWAKTLLIQSLLAISLLWLVSLFLRRRWPRVAPPAGVAALSLLALGWLSSLNASASYDELAQMFSPVSPALPGWPGTWDRAFSVDSMRLVTALMGAFFISMDFAANPAWRRRLYFTLSLNGGLLLLFGLAQRAASAEGIFWGPASSGPFFATYVNHSNAGAFINLTLPILAGRAFLAFQKRENQVGRAFWSFLLLVNVAAIFVNTSRASMLIGILLTSALALGGTRAFIHRGGNLRPRFLALAGVILACVLVLTLSVGVERSLTRWNQTMNALFLSSDGSFSDGRARIYRVCWLSLPAAGWFGFGPGTFAIVFPFLRHEQGVELSGLLRYAHQDYLQTMLEWGAVGFALWAVLLGGGIARVVSYLWKGSVAIPREHALELALAALSIVGVLVHSLFDFPLQIASLQLVTAVLLGQLWVRLPRRRIAPTARTGGGAAGPGFGRGQTGSHQSRPGHAGIGKAITGVRDPQLASFL